MREFRFVFWCLLLAFSPKALALEPSLIPLIQNGPVGNRVNFLIMPEGYTAAELPKFQQDASVLAGRILGEPPFSWYSNYFNIYAVLVASAESGSDHPSQGVFRDTYFNSSYERMASHAITIPPYIGNTNYAEGQGKVDALATRFLPEADIKMLLVNDPIYGGYAAATAIASVHPQSVEIMLHELGHSLGGLGEEYTGPGANSGEAPNTTRETRRELIKWSAWIDPATPIPTPNEFTYKDVVGLFEGAAYNERGWYRPKLNCKMRTLGVPFCEVCSEALILALYFRVNPIDSVTPQPGEIRLEGGGLQFQLTPQRPSRNPLRTEWRVDGELLSRETRAMALPANFLGPGAHQVSVLVADPTDRVKKYRNWLSQEESWTVHASAAERPALLALPNPSGIELIWSANWQGYELQQSTESSGSNVAWQTVIPSARTDKFVRFQVETSQPRAFYRLISPAFPPPVRP